MVDPARDSGLEAGPARGLDTIGRFHEIVADRLGADEDPFAARRSALEAIAEAMDLDAALLRVHNPRRSAPLEVLTAGTVDTDVLARFEADGTLPLAGSRVASVALSLTDGLDGTIVALRAAGLDDDDREVLSALGGHMATLIEYSRRLHSEQKQRLLAQTLHQVSTAMTSSLDLKAVLEGVLDGLAEVMEYDTAAVVLHQDEHLWVMAGRGLDMREIRNLKVPAADDPIFAQMQEAKEPIVTTDWAEFGESPKYVGNGDGPWMAVPLAARREVIGMLAVDARGSHPNNAVEIVSAFAAQAAIAISNARLFQRTQLALAKTEALFHTAQALIGSESLEALLQLVVDGAARAIPADRVALVTVNTNTRRIIHFLRGGPGRDRLVSVEYDELWDGLSGWVLRERKPVLSLGNRADEREGAVAAQRRRLTGAGSTMVVPVRYRGKLFGTLTAVNRADEREFTSRDVELLTALANQAAMAIENARLFDEVQRLAVTDDLTGLSNRRGFFDLARRELDRAERTGRPATALMLDIDKFKKINDTYGHAVGDQVLRQLAERATIAVREVDLVGRYGGEEFAFLLPETDLETAVFIAGRIRTKIAESPFRTDAGPLDIRVSIGAAPADPEGESVAALLDRADSVMYEAKRDGGNTVRSAADPQ